MSTLFSICPFGLLGKKTGDGTERGELVLVYMIASAVRELTT